MSAPLALPRLPDDCDLMRAALIYANAGWFVGPLLPKSKHPGSILGNHWQHKTSDQKDQIVEWFAGTAAGGVFLHCGRSGAIVFDVDRPDNVPPILAQFLWSGEGAERVVLVPFQSTRPEEPWRGHYFFLQPSDRLLGNALGTLAAGWGEIRGYNGIIVVEPTTHETDGARYHFEVCGEVPGLPDVLSAEIPDMGAIEDAATDSAVKKFMATHITSTRGALMQAPVDQYLKKVADGESRHESMVSVACMAMRDAAMGFYPARSIANDLFTEFHRSFKLPDGTMTPRRWPKSEFKSIIAFAVGQALGVDAEERRAVVMARLRSRDEARKEALPAPMGQDDIPSDPTKYFLDKTVGLDVSLLARDVLELGPIAIGADGEFWAYRESGVWRRDKRVVQDRCVHLLGPKYRPAHTNAAEHVVQARVDTLTVEPVAEYWNCTNGMLDWRTGELLPHDPSFHSTVQFPWDWDENAQCPEFDAFIGDILSPDYALLMWEMIAYLLYSGNPLQAAFMLYGKGSNGKGTILRVLTTMLGKESISALTLTAMNRSRFAVASLHGKIANIAGDIDATFQEDTAMFRSLTGEDMISGEHKFGAHFQFSCWAVPVFSANAIPGAKDPGFGYLRRWKVIIFEKTFTDDQLIRDLDRRFHSEIPGIAAKAMPVLRALMAKGNFKSDGDVAVGKEMFEEAVDQVRAWVKEATIPAADHAENRNVLYQSYRAWAEANGVGRLRAPEFYTRLETAGFEQTKRQGIRSFVGIRVEDFRMKSMANEREPSDD